MSQSHPIYVGEEGKRMREARGREGKRGNVNTRRIEL